MRLSKMARQLYKYQEKLPSLPVPPLQHTLELYKESIKPFYKDGERDTEYINYAAIIDKFAIDEGIKLQEKLIKFASNKRNWLAEFWDNYAYLEYRDPVSPFVSYFFNHGDVKYKNVLSNDQLLKSTFIILKVLEFSKSIEDESLTPELVKNSPFCMESFKWMFNNSRIPNAKRDINVKYDPKEGRFVIILSKGWVFKLFTHDSRNDEILSFNEIYNQLIQIEKTCNLRGENPNPIGILTSSNRDEWFENYQILSSISSQNVSNLLVINKSLFVLCLDDNSPTTIEEKSRNSWHGNGFNRWFDKPVQMFVSRNGNSGFLGEHSKMDGTPTLRMNDWLVEEMKNFKLSPSDLNRNDNIQSIELKFDINGKLSKEIQNQMVKFKETVGSLSIKTWQYFGLGKNDIKLFKCSPDSFVQMLIQLAYYKYTGTLKPTYESASTRRFFKGRTETCRSVSLEALQFVKDWENPTVPVERKLKSLDLALKSHNNYIRLASNGEGVDRHLFGLKQMVEEQTPIVDKFFNNPIFNYSSYWYLSTSQLSSENFNGYGWSPVVPEGLGLAYMINSDWLHINITAFKENPMNLKPEEMAYYLTVAVNELKDALSQKKLDPKL